MESYRIHPETPVYFITCSVVDWLPVFVAEPACKIVTDSLTYCHDHKGLRINAYVIMPTHLHLILFHESYTSEPLSLTLDHFRRYTGRSLADHCLEHAPACFNDTLRQAASGDRARKFWQHSRHPYAITSQRIWQQKLDYLHDNPRRKGLVRYAEDWRFSSARYYAAGEDTDMDVPIIQLEW